MGLSQLGQSGVGGGSPTLDTNTATSGLSGLLKSASNSLESAVAGTDYLEPSAIGTIASQNANSVSITGGSITGLSALTASAGTLTASAPFTLSQTWNNAAVTFSGFRLNYTNAASNAASVLFDCLVDSGSLFQVRRDGTITSGFVSFNFSNCSANPNSSGSFVVGSNSGFHFVSTSPNSFTPPDTFLRGPAPATLQLGLTHATTPTAQTIKAHNVTTGTGASLTIQGGSGSAARGNVILDGGNRSAYIASPTSEQIRDILISHGLMAAS